MKNKKLFIILGCIILILLIGVGVYFEFLKDNSKSYTIDDFKECTKENPCEIKNKFKTYNLVYEQDLESPYDGNLYLNDKLVISFKYPQNNLREIHVIKDVLVLLMHVGADVRPQFFEVYDLNGNMIRRINQLEELIGMEPSNGTTVENNKLIIEGSRKSHNHDAEIGDWVCLCDNPSHSDNAEIGLSELVSKGIVNMTDPLTAKYELTYDEIVNNKSPRLVEVVQTFEDYVSKNCTDD